MKSTTPQALCCLCIIFCAHNCNAWTVPSLTSSIRKNRVDLEPNHGGAPSDTSLANCLRIQPLSKFLLRAFISRIAPPLVAASLLFGAAEVAIASDETLLFDLSKEDSVIIDGRSPPEIKATSSEEAIALSTKMKALNARMYGAYWCKFCAKQKEAFGKESFETNLEYIECSEDGKNSQATTLCEEKSIRGFPTWEINGKLYSGERSLEEMKVLVRMAGASSPGRDKAPPMILTSSSERAMGIANKLKALNANLFGAYWDPHTFEAKERLGAGAMAELPYTECSKDGDNSQLDLCKEKSVQVVPTWSIDGKLHMGDLSFEELEQIIASTADKPSDQDNALTAVAATSEAKTSQPSPPSTTTSSTEKTLALAKQMESLNTRMYGAYFCTHCKDQKELFGKEAFGRIPYVECTEDGKDSQLPLCSKKGVKSVPTWEINGKLFVGQRSIDQLQELVSAELSQKQQPTIKASANEGKAPPPILATSSDQALRLASSMESLDAKLYGAHWCRFTQFQREKFGEEAFKKIQYVECSQDGLNSATSVCRDMGIEGFPTWSLGGKLYPGDMELSELEEIVKDLSER